VLPLPAPPEESVHWGEYPHLTPWLATIDEGQRFAVALVDKERARVLTVFLGRVESSRSFTDEVPGKQKTGDWFGLSERRYERHHDEHVRRHLKPVAAALEEIEERAPFERLVVGGPPEALRAFEQALAPALRARIVGRITAGLFAPDDEIVVAAKPVVERAERSDETELVQHTITRAAKGEAAATGEQNVMASLDAGRVHRLLLTETFDRREAAVAKAFETGADIEFVRGDAAAALASHGGIAAVLRYQG
jgi:peptide subunit release factor 1 (eRF1)